MTNVATSHLPGGAFPPSLEQRLDIGLAWLNERGLTVENLGDRLEILELFSRYAFAMDEPDPVGITGHYHGTVVKEDGHWKFAERHAVPDSTETGWA